MARLIYTFPVSLDGYVADEEGRFEWAEPDDEVFAFINDQQRPIGTYLYGRRLYETMAGWETDPAFAAQSEFTRDFAGLWRAAEKIVYSTTLPRAVTTKTRIERAFDADAVRHLKATTDRDLTVGGPGLAAHAIRAGLVDEYQLLISPYVMGGGNHVFPADVRLRLELLEERRFRNGTVFVRYRNADPST